MLLAIFRPEGLLPPRRTVRAKQLEHEIEALEEGRSTTRRRHHRRRLTATVPERHDPQRTGVPAPRGRQRHAAVRRPDRSRRRVLPHRRGRDPRPHRPQRCRQDHLLQRGHRRLPPTSGDIRFNGESLTGKKRHRDHPARASRAPSRTSGCSATMTALENVLVGADAQHSTGLLERALPAAAAPPGGAAGPRPGDGAAAFMGLASRPTSSPRTCRTATSGGSRSPVPWPPSRS